MDGCAVRGEQRREQHVAAQRRQAQAQLATVQAFQFGQLGAQVVALHQHGLRAAVHHLAGLGHAHAVAVALQQRHADPSSSSAIALLTVGWVAWMARAAAEKPPLLHHFNEYPQMPDVHAVPEWMGFRQFILLMNSPGA